jgi:hypothetical protein
LGLAQAPAVLRPAPPRRPAAGNDDFLWTATGGRGRSSTCALKKVKRAATIASTRREARGLPPPSSVTPHTLRHTDISILLLVTENVTCVMEQVGHDDARLGEERQSPAFAGLFADAPGRIRTCGLLLRRHSRTGR